MTGQFPIYAHRVGRIHGIEGLAEARAIPGVVDVIVATHRGERIQSVRKENYLAFVILAADSHEEVRQLERRVRACLRVIYLKE